MREDLMGSKSSAVMTSPLGSAPCSLMYCSMSRFSYTTPLKSRLAVSHCQMQIAVSPLLTRLLGRDRLLGSFSRDCASVSKLQAGRESK
jgi:hypothetical protein